MSLKAPNRTSLRKHVHVFAALGDQTRLALVARLSEGPGLSISRLAAGTLLTRQAVAKHLGVLQKAGLVRAVHRGRERLFHFDPKSVEQARHSLERISRQWDEALLNLKSHVER